MPKITKRTTKKVNSKNKSILSKRFDLKSRKVQFFASILIIAVIGGGYFTFRSFAATDKVSQFAVNANFNGIKLEEGRRQTSKKGSWVVEVKKGQYITWFTGIKVIAGNKYKACVNASALGSSRQIDIHVQGARAVFNNAAGGIPADGSYGWACNEFIGESNIPNALVRVAGTSASGSTRVSMMSFETTLYKTSERAAPAPANPVPVK